MEAGSTPYNGRVRSIVAGNGKFFYTGQTATNVPWIHPTTTGFITSGTTRIVDIPGITASDYGGNDQFLFMTPERVETYNAGLWGKYTNVAYGNNTNIPANWRDPRSVVIATGGPLGSAAAPVAFALIGIDSPFVSAITRDIWSSGPTNFGSTWVKRATLPAISATTTYWNLAYNNKVLVAIGDGILMATKDGTNWYRVDIPAGSWRGVATDGTDFVCVSQSGDRLKISGANVESRTS